VSESLPYSSSSGNVISVPCCGDNSCGQTDVHDLVWKFQSLKVVNRMLTLLKISSEQNAHFIENMNDVFFNCLITQSQLHQQCQQHLPPPHVQF